MNERYYINGVGISVVNFQDALDEISQQVQKKQAAYICVTNTRTTYLANKDKDYCKIQNNSLLTVPDGTPLIWIAHLKGFEKIQRIAGLDLLKSILDISKEKKYSHYFYGSTRETISLIKKRLYNEYPEIEIKGAESPSFQPIEKFNIQEIADIINKECPTFFWCGLGAPKQERLIALLQPKLKSTICIGIGLAFEYYAGTVHVPPAIVVKFKMEWFYRSLQQPIKARRFILPFFFMIKVLIRTFIRSIIK